MAKEKESVGLEFNVVQEKDVLAWARSSRFGRFMALKESLLAQVQGLRRNQALTFTTPDDDKEMRAIYNTCTSLFKKEKLPFKLRLSKTKRLIAVIHTDEQGEN